MGREPLDRVGEEGPVDQRDRRLRHLAGQRPQAGPLAADQDDRLHVARRGRPAGEFPAAADALVLEAGPDELLGVEEVAAIDDQRPRHLLRRGPVELGELAPLGDEDGGVGALECLRRRGGHLDRAEQLRGALGGDRVIGDYLRPLALQARREDQAGGLAHVVGVGLEGKAEQGDPLADQRAEVLLELADDPALLQLVDLDHRGQQLEVIAGVAGQHLQRADVLREAAAAVADAGAEEGAADPLVEPHPLRHLADVGAYLLADVGDLVDEGDLRRQEGVGGELDHLGAGDVGAEDLAAERLIEPPTASAASSSPRSAPITTRSGFMKSATAVPSLRNSGQET